MEEIEMRCRDGLFQTRHDDVLVRQLFLHDRLKTVHSSCGQHPPQPRAQRSLSTRGCSGLALPTAGSNHMRTAAAASVKVQITADELC